MINKVKNNLLLIIAFFLGIFVSTTVTLVLAHGGDTSFVHACVKNTIGIVRIVGANDTCGNGETAVDWSKGSLFSTFPVCPNCDLRSKVLTGLDLTRAYFINANLSGLNLSSATLANANLERADLSNTNLSQATLSEAILSFVDLSGAIMSNAKIVDSQLEGANLTNANLSNVDLTNAQMGDIIAQNTNLSGANLTNTSIGVGHFQGTNLRGVQWNGANLNSSSFSNADLTGSLNFGTTNRSGVTWSNTICPDGTNSNNNGGTCEGHF